MKPSLFIRADASSHIGTGHIMRCLALGQFWKDIGGNVTFLSHCESGALQQRIMDEGFDFISIERSHPDPYDLESILRILEKSEVQKSEFQDWVVLDGYHFTSDYQKAIKKNGHRLLFIDDMAHLNHYSADILLNQNIHAQTLKYSCEKDTMKLLCCDYVLLRREFRQFKKREKKIPERAKKILVTMGGADPENVTLKVVKAINSLNDPDLEVKVIAGPSNPNVPALEKELSHSSFTYHLLKNVRCMSEVMAWADMAVSAGGSTCWELAFMGVPSLIITAVDNQAGIAEGVGIAGACIDLGWHENVSIKRCAQIFEQALRDREKRAHLCEQGKRLIDGKGAKRITRTMLIGQIKLRRAQEDDCEQLWRWVNDTSVRKASFNSEKITWEDHKTWFLSKLRNPDCMLYVALNQYGMPIGQIRFDINELIAEISYSIDSKFRGLGLGEFLLKEGLELFRTQTRRAVMIQARVKKSNKPSKRVFENLGFFELGKKPFGEHNVIENYIIYGL